MSTIGYGYGSEWHLLRYLGYHRSQLNRAILVAIVGSDDEPIEPAAVREPAAAGVDMLTWLDFEPASEPSWRPGSWHKPIKVHDREHAGLDFLAADDAREHVLARYREFWPQRGSNPTWDAVGVYAHDDVTEWILVEAKAHTAELRSSGCGAKEPSRSRIAAAFAAVQRDQGVVADADWTGAYYQYCNRLATLWFLREHGVAARFVHLFFCGDEWPTQKPDRPVPPTDRAGWQGAIEEMERAVGLPPDAPIRLYVHHVFLNVNADLPS